LIEGKVSLFRPIEIKPKRYVYEQNLGSHLWEDGCGAQADAGTCSSSDGALLSTPEKVSTDAVRIENSARRKKGGGVAVSRPRSDATNPCR